MMAWRRLGDGPLSEPMMVRLPMHICLSALRTRPFLTNFYITETTVNRVHKRRVALADEVISTHQNHPSAMKYERSTKYPETLFLPMP